MVAHTSKYIGNSALEISTNMLNIVNENIIYFIFKNMLCTNLLLNALHRLEKI